MPNVDDTELDELATVTNKDEQDVDAQITQEGEEETTELDLDTLEEEKEETSVAKPTPAEVSAKQQEDAWYAKVVSGKSDIAEAPKWLQPKLEKRLNVESTPNIEEVIEQKLQAKLEDERFKDLTETVKDLNLSKAQAEKLKLEYKRLRPAGKVVALQTAIELIGMGKKVQEAERRGMAKGRMSLPPSGQPKEKSKDDILAIAKDEKKWKAFMKSMKA